MNMYGILREGQEAAKHKLSEELIHHIKDNKTYGLLVMKVTLGVFLFLNSVMFGLLLPIKIIFFM